MNLADELRKLQELRQDGTLTEAEFAAAKAKVIAQGASSSSGTDEAMQQHLEDIKRQNEVAQLDRQWELERERYMVPGQYGSRHLPSKGLSVLGGILIAGFGIVWVGVAATITSGIGGAASCFPLFGLVFIAVGVGMSIYSFNKASQFDEAHSRYQRRRAELLGAEGKDSPGFQDERIQE